MPINDPNEDYTGILIKDTYETVIHIGGSGNLSNSLYDGTGSLINISWNNLSSSLYPLSSSFQSRLTAQEIFSSSLDATFATDEELSIVSQSSANIINGNITIPSSSVSITSSYSLNGLNNAVDITNGISIIGSGSSTFSITHDNSSATISSQGSLIRIPDNALRFPISGPGIYNTFLEWGFPGYGIGSNNNGETIFHINNFSVAKFGNFGLNFLSNFGCDIKGTGIHDMNIQGNPNIVSPVDSGNENINLIAGSDGSVRIYDRTSTPTNFIQFYHTTTQGIINANSTPLTLSYDNVTYATRITVGNGTLNFAANGNYLYMAGNKNRFYKDAVPHSDASSMLGAESTKWSELHVYDIYANTISASFISSSIGFDSVIGLTEFSQSVSSSFADLSGSFEILNSSDINNDSTVSGSTVADALEYLLAVTNSLSVNGSDGEVLYASSGGISSSGDFLWDGSGLSIAGSKSNLNATLQLSTKIAGGELLTATNQGGSTIQIVGTTGGGDGFFQTNKSNGAASIVLAAAKDQLLAYENESAANKPTWPNFSWASDRDSGLYRISTNKIALIGGGSDTSTAAEITLGSGSGFIVNSQNTNTDFIINRNSTGIAYQYDASELTHSFNDHVEFNGNVSYNTSIKKTYIITSSFSASFSGNDQIYFCKAPSNIDIHLPSSTAGDQKTFILTSGSGYLYVNPSGSQMINGDSQKIITSLYSAMTIIADGENWYII